MQVLVSKSGSQQVRKHLKNILLKIRFILYWSIFTWLSAKPTQYSNAVREWSQKRKHKIMVFDRTPFSHWLPVSNQLNIFPFFRIPFFLLLDVDTYTNKNIFLCKNRKEIMHHSSSQQQDHVHEMGHKKTTNMVP